MAHKPYHKFLLIGLAVFLLIAILVDPNWFLGFTRTSSSNKLAREVFGRVEKKSLQATTYQSVGNGESIDSGDLFLTHADSKVLFEFDTPFWLMPFSKVEMIKNDNTWTAHLIYGQIKKLPAIVTNDHVEFVHNGQAITSDEFSTTQDNLEAPVVSLDSEAFKDLAAGEAPPQNVVERQIFETLLLYKKFFQGCVVKHYKQKGGQVSTGETVFDLSIDVNGSIENAKVMRTVVTDTEYLECLRIVFSRIRFKNLQIQRPLHAVFPLNIEL